MVHHKVHDEAGPGLPLLPRQDPKSALTARPSTAATLNLAAVAAQAARLFEPYDAGFAARLLAAADRVRGGPAPPGVFAPDADGDRRRRAVRRQERHRRVLLGRGRAVPDDRRAAVPRRRPGQRLHTADAFSPNGFYWGSMAALGRLDLAPSRPS